MGSVFEIIPVKIGPGDRVEMVEVVGTKGRKTIKSHELRMALGAKELKSTVFSLDGDGGTTRRDVLAASEDFIDESQSDSATLISLTQEGAFTSEELMDMLLHPEKRGEYLKKPWPAGENRLPRHRKNHRKRIRNFYGHSGIRPLTMKSRREECVVRPFYFKGRVGVME